MSLRTIRIGVLCAAVLPATLTVAAQQPVPTQRLRITSTEIGATLSLEHAQIAQVNGNTFWLKGGSLDGAITFYRGLGLAANLTGEHASNIQGSVGLGKLAFMAGPRYTFDTSHATRGIFKGHPTQLFGEWLFGGVHAFDSVFPGNSNTASTAGAFSMQLGGGADIALAKGFALRALELDYISTHLPNNGANSQNDLRIAFGVSYRH